MDTLHRPNLGNEGKWEFLLGVCAQLLLMRTHFAFSLGYWIPLGALFPKVCGKSYRDLGPNLF